MDDKRSLSFWTNWLLIGGIVLLADAISTFFLAKLYATGGYNLLYGANAHHALPTEAIS